MSLRISGIFRRSACILAEFTTLTPRLRGGFAEGFDGGTGYKGRGSHLMPIASSGGEYFRDMYPHWYRRGAINANVHPRTLRHHGHSAHWFVIDAAGESIEVTAAKAAKVVSGQASAVYTGDGVSEAPHVVVINCKDMVMSDKDWETKPWWTFRSQRRPNVGTLMMRSKQLYQKDPCLLMFYYIWNFLPSHRKESPLHPISRTSPHQRVFLSRRLHLFNHHEHPYEHMFPRDVTDRTIVSKAEYDPVVQFVPHHTSYKRLESGLVRTTVGWDKVGTFKPERGGALARNGQPSEHDRRNILK